ncbi:LegC family aminotransferase [Campylobacter sp. MIT 21-1685]|uniref:LegC family aminotransferase n=1 Tax=unclassified Campylobacter TaxID=2593542 RepID=UPI00224B1825|nr:MULTISPECIES: LegC family aminotransferase [unclassified Campylobacter]MCX2683717.1 LegC family aminotransferase [Campylobacter sp. MIT 21-1684]MCX2752017.1 LegC family aminotransferase [Campylobacter sp. MIT 21-1682]MCX2808201.1 LegC family aminotransferase [Campylobacter sp. MIT 21-1685]
MFEKEIAFIKELFIQKKEIPLHEPCFQGKEKQYVNECLESGFVSSIGAFVSRLEKDLQEFTGSKFAVATNSGTSALHLALLANGIDKECEVITQSLSFVATANAIAYTGANPIFLDVDTKTLSLSPEALQNFLEKESFTNGGKTFNKTTKKHIKACIIMHTFGLSAELTTLSELCQKYNIIVIEDAAEALGSFYHNKALGTFGKCGILSFNGNKIITGGCGGALLSDDETIATFARHLSTTAKLPHPYEYEHDYIAYNYRLSNINAAIIVAGLENITFFLAKKRELAQLYKNFFAENEFCTFVDEAENTKSNFWLNTLIFKEHKLRELFIKECYENSILVRPVWKSLPSLKMYQQCQKDTLANTKILEQTLLSLPSSVRM